MKQKANQLIKMTQKPLSRLHIFIYLVANKLPVQRTDDDDGICVEKRLKTKTKKTLILKFFSARFAAGIKVKGE